MNPVELIRPNVRAMQGYAPGWQPGPGKRYIKLNTNENPYPPSPKVIEALQAMVNGDLRLYPNPDSCPLRGQVATLYGFTPEQVICGNGSDEVLAMLFRTFMSEGESVAYFEPSYSLYPILADIAGATREVFPLPRDLAEVKRPTIRSKLFFLTTPNAPYGFRFPNLWIADLLEHHEGIVVADEAYVDFAEDSALPLLHTHDNLIVVHTLSKSYALAGMRVGFALAAEGVITEMMKVRDSYNLDRLAQVAAVAALCDQAYVREQSTRVKRTRQWLSDRLTELGFRVLPSEANFLFVMPPAQVEAAALYQALFEAHILVRYFSTPRLADGLRISIGTDEQAEALLAEIQRIFKNGTEA